jgi:hypothetical protein
MTAAERFDRSVLTGWLLTFMAGLLAGKRI